MTTTTITPFAPKGGAHIVSLNDSRESSRDLPVYIRRHPELHLGEARGALVSR